MAAKADTTAGIRKLWGIAKSPELRLSDEDLHLVVQAHTGKDSIKELNNRELNTCIRVLLNMKDSAKGKNGSTKRRRSGNPATENQRKKVYKLTQELGWEKPARVNGLCMKMFKVSSVEWLNYQQCSKLIEALKSMAARKEKQDEGLQADNNSQGCTLPLSLPEKAMFGNIGRERPGCQQRCNSGRYILRSEPMRLRATHQRRTCACARLIVTTRAMRGL